jgi:hypothetical protein
MKLEEANKGDLVLIDGNSGFCAPPTWEKIIAIDYRYDEISGEKYKRIFVGGGCFDSRNGSAITYPSSYYITECKTEKQLLQG